MLPNDLDEKLSNATVRLATKSCHQLKKNAVLHLQQPAECSIAVAFPKALKILSDL